MKTYNTNQRQIIVDFLKNNSETQYTIEQIASKTVSVGKSTVYRLINKMVDEGVVSRRVKGNS